MNRIYEANSITAYIGNYNTKEDFIWLVDKEIVLRRSYTTKPSTCILGCYPESAIVCAPGSIQTTVRLTCRMGMKNIEANRLGGTRAHVECTNQWN